MAENFSLFREHELANSGHQVKAKEKESRVKGYSKRKKASHINALGEADEEFLWRSCELGKHSAQA